MPRRFFGQAARRAGASDTDAAMALAQSGPTSARHPKGLSTLFFTEMWERFSYYGMRALLILFMTTATGEANPGLEMDTRTAGAIYGIYTGLVYLLGLPGGWVADRLWGQRKAVFVGGCIIAAGHFTLAFNSTWTFFLGLLLVVLGTGLLKPNVSSLVADLYPEGGARRDAGFSIFYMGINLGAFLGSTVCPFLAEGYNWHWGFAAAGVGMVAGLIQFRLGYGRLGDAGALKTSDAPQELAARRRRFHAALGVSALLVGAVFLLSATDAIAIDAALIANWFAIAASVVLGGYFAWVLLFGGHDPEQRRKIVVIAWLTVLAAVFWSGFEQAGSTLNLFARDYTDRVLGSGGWSWEVPAGWLQSVNSLFIIILAPVFGWLWVWLASRNRNPSVPTKFALGLLGLSAGFFVIMWGAANATPENPTGMSWLVAMYFLHTVGELALSPVGLSAMTKLAPPSRVSQMVGVWFVATALGNVISGRVAGALENLEPAPLFSYVAAIVGGTGLVALLVSPFARRLMK